MLIRPTLAALCLIPALAACGSEPEASETGGTCFYPTGPREASKKVDLPPTEPVETGERDVTLSTNQGDIAVTLDGAAAPCTVNSFLSLAEQGYFDDTNCHRLEVGFVLQCGDPTELGTGGPGYSFADELTGEETYPRGTLAMANAGANTNGSQFFIVLEDAPLGASFTVFGSVSDTGMETVDGIVANGTLPQSSTPKEPVTITAVK